MGIFSPGGRASFFSLCFFSAMRRVILVFRFLFWGLALFATIFARAHVPYLNLEILMQERKVS